VNEPNDPMARQDEGPLARLEVREGVAEIVLDRPAKMNAMTSEMVRRLRDLLGEVAGTGARAVLIRGEGRAFSAGRDIAGAQPGVEDGGQVLEDVFNPLMLEVAELPLPTFAAVHGACLGTGLGVALACDVVYAAHDARIGSPFAQIGAVLDSGAHQAFVARLGPHRALEMVYTGRLLSGREAAGWGLVNASFELDRLLDQTREVAGRVASGPTAAFLESKRLVRAVLDDGLSLAEVLTAEAEAQRRASRSEDYVEGFTAFLEKRTPTFRGR
jgi:2-(1,2-epoxy-1,2-dihydrophenyl)acetyl-CoA isomerase